MIGCTLEEWTEFEKEYCTEKTIDENIYGNIKERWVFATKMEEEYGNPQYRDNPGYLGAGYPNIPWVRWNDEGYADRANLLARTFVRNYRLDPTITVKEVVEILKNSGEVA